MIMKHNNKNSHIMLTYLPGGEIKRDPEIGKTAMQPEPAQTADLSVTFNFLTLYINSTTSYSVEPLWPPP